MRISDWSSDVCSSDLGGSTAPGRGPDSRFRGNDERGQDRERAQHRPGPRPEPRPHETNAPRPPANAAEAMLFDDDAQRREHTPRHPRDRKSGVQGKRVEVRVALVGRCIITKKIQTTTKN